MRKKIFLTTFLTTLFVLLFSLAMSAMILFRFFEERSEDELKQEASAIASGTDEYGIDYLTRLKSERRITLIDTDGTVLYDNEADPLEMENHKNRTEVKEAFASGSGTSIRYSSTMTEETIYYALRLDDGQVLRIAATQDSIYAWLIKLLVPAGAIFVIAVCASLIISSRLSRSILTPINNLNLDDPEKNNTYEELHPLLERIATQNKTIRSQEREESEKREKFRREFTANVSHELKTPLTSISGFAELMKQGGMDEETVIDFSTTIYDESQRLITLVNDIIRLSSLEDRDIQYEWENVGLLGLSKDVASRLQPAADRRRVKLLVIGGEQNVYGIWDLIYEMVYNVCDNAVKYNKENGAVTITVGGDEKTASVSVEDTGIGIPKEDIDRIFERFYRVDKSHSKAVGGTGLGLSIVKHGAIIHHAHIHVHSTLGQGTEIILEFPKKQDESRFDAPANKK